VAKSQKHSPYHETTTWKTRGWAIGLGLTGIIGLFLTSGGDWVADWKLLQTVIRELSGLTIASVALALLWELKVRRSFVDEVLALSAISASVKEAGIVEATTEFYEDIRWRDLLQNAKRVDVLLSFGRTWRSNNSQLLTELAGRKGLVVRLAMPDQTDKDLVNILAQRYRKSVEDILSRLKDTEDDFRKRFTGAKAKLEIWRLRFPPLYTYYRIDNRAVFTSYRHREDKGAVVVLSVMQPGFFFKFLEDEFKACLENSALSTKAFPEKKTAVK
jgi:hypothetical protein